MMNLNNLMEIGAFSLYQAEKDRLLYEILKDLTFFHYSNYSPYRKMLDALGYDAEVPINSCSQIPFLPVSLFKKLETICLMANSFEIKNIHSNSNNIFRVELEKPAPHILELRCGNGFFIEYEVIEMAEILPFCTQRCQTITFGGIDKEALLKLIHSNRVSGVDRIVKIGRALEFSFVWDGVDMIAYLSRKIILQ